MFLQTHREDGQDSLPLEILFGDFASTSDAHHSMSPLTTVPSPEDRLVDCRYRAIIPDVGRKAGRMRSAFQEFCAGGSIPPAATRLRFASSKQLGYGCFGLPFNFGCGPVLLLLT